MKNPYAWIDHSLEVIHRAHWSRSVKPIDASQAQGTELLINGQPVINFASNDYLGLATHPQVQAAAIAAVDAFGTGATGSRLLSGQRPIHRQLEEAIAHWKRTEAALVFSSGYLANLSTIQAIVGPRDLIVADIYNHSSLKNGAKLSGAEVLEFSHGSMADLEELLVNNRANYRRCLIVTDGVFSMDGDLCHLPEIFALSQRHDSMVLIDEAHATGVVGQTGSGCMEHFQYLGSPVIQIGTLSKALGSLGGYVAGSQSLIEFLRNRGSGWIYTTGLSPGDCAAALAAIQLCRSQPAYLQSLWQNISALKEGLMSIASGSDQKLSSLPTDSAIACLEFDKPETVLALSQSLLERGCFVPAIRPPTVPTSRLRISLMATHSEAQIELLISALLEMLV
ncbi:MAG: 8-amino-7-oxononanoate synthase [Cyanobacteria bacterium P01_F01_bin.42]